MLGEVLLARHTNDDVFGQYSLVRQAIPVVCAVGLMGYDQALTRETAARRAGVPPVDRRQGTLVLATALLGLLASTYLALGLGVSLESALALAMAAPAVSVANLVSGGMRAAGHTARGAFAQQGYRLIAGVGLVLGSPLLGTWAGAVLAIGSLAVASWALIWNRRQPAHWSPDGNHHRLMRRLGVGYAVSLLALSLGDWLDQVLVAELGDLAQTGIYSQAKLLAFYPALSLGSILGFLALPAIAARREQLTSELVARGFATATLLSVLIGACAAVASALAAPWLVGRPLDGPLVALLAAVGAMRLFYVLPSAVVGATGTPRALAVLGGWGVAGVVAQALTTVALAAPLGVLRAAALGLLVSASVRCAASSVLALRHCEDHVTLTTPKVEVS